MDGKVTTGAVDNIVMLKGLRVSVRQSYKLSRSQNPDPLGYPGRSPHLVRNGVSPPAVP